MGTTHISKDRQKEKTLAATTKTRTCPDVRMVSLDRHAKGISGSSMNSFSHLGGSVVDPLQNKPVGLHKDVKADTHRLTMTTSAGQQQQNFPKQNVLQGSSLSKNRKDSLQNLHGRLRGTNYFQEMNCYPVRSSFSSSASSSKNYHNYDCYPQNTSKQDDMSSNKGKAKETGKSQQQQNIKESSSSLENRKKSLQRVDIRGSLSSKHYRYDNDECHMQNPSKQDGMSSNKGRDKETGKSQQQQKQNVEESSSSIENKKESFQRVDICGDRLSSKHYDNDKCHPQITSKQDDMSSNKGKAKETGKSQQQQNVKESSSSLENRKKSLQRVDIRGSLSSKHYRYNNDECHMQNPSKQDGMSSNKGRDKEMGKSQQQQKQNVEESHSFLENKKESLQRVNIHVCGVSLSSKHYDECHMQNPSKPDDISSNKGRDKETGKSQQQQKQNVEESSSSIENKKESFQRLDICGDRLSSKHYRYNNDECHLQTPSKQDGMSRNKGRDKEMGKSQQQQKQNVEESHSFLENKKIFAKG